MVIQAKVARMASEKLAYIQQLASETVSCRVMENTGSMNSDSSLPLLCGNFGKIK